MPQAMELLPDHNVHTRLSDAKKEQQSKLKTIQKRPQSRIRLPNSRAQRIAAIFISTMRSVFGLQYLSRTLMFFSPQ
jgi:hypothetical protein